MRDTTTRDFEDTAMPGSTAAASGTKVLGVDQPQTGLMAPLRTAPPLLATLFGQQSHFFLLPVELIQEIMIIAILNDVYSLEHDFFAGAAHMSTRLALVCSSWNAVLRSLSRQSWLYRVVNLGSRSLRPDIDEDTKSALMHSYLARSADGPLHVIIDTDHLFDGREPPYLQALLYESHRWETATFRGDFRDAAAHGTLLSISLDLPILQHLDLEHERRDHTPRALTRRPRYCVFEDARALRSVGLAGEDFVDDVDMQLPCAGVRKLVCVNIHSADVLELLEDMPELQECAWFIDRPCFPTDGAVAEQFEYGQEMWQDDDEDEDEEGDDDESKKDEGPLELRSLTKLCIGNTEHAIQSGMLYQVCLPALREAILDSSTDYVGDAMNALCDEARGEPSITLIDKGGPLSPPVHLSHI
ncbi:hypothetical protein HDZ31DRAFT_74572 [Schizophyllum fasciatum]